MSRITKESLGQAIAEVRQREGMTQEVLGRVTELGQTVISRIESGSRRLEATELVQIADALRIEVSDLLEQAATPTVDDIPDIELVALRLAGAGLDAAGSLAWVPDFLRRLDDLEQRVDG